MSFPTLFGADNLGIFAFFIEEGTDIGGDPASETLAPDTDSTDDLTNLGDIQEAAFGSDGTDDSYFRLLPSGRKVKQPVKNIESDYFDFTSRQMQEYIWRLQTGVGGKIVPGTAQTPANASDRFVRGWLYLQGRRVGTGSDRFRLLMWGELRLETNIKINNKVIPAALRFYKTNELDLESVVFPA